jgi:predicted nucleic acid-binding protein
VGEGLFQASWGRFRESEGLSFTDCVSFSFMREKGVARAFTFDDHFRREKFETIP